MKKIWNVSDFFPLLCYCCYTKTSEVQSFNIDQRNSDKLIKHWLLLPVTSSRFDISFGCLLSIHLKVLLTGLKMFLFNLCLQPSGQRKKCSQFLTQTHSFAVTHGHVSMFTGILLAAFSTMWISVQITNNNNATKSKILISFCKLKKKKKTHITSGSCGSH